MNKLPIAFKRNQLKNLARTKGYTVVRFWHKQYKEWHYRIERIKYLRNAPKRYDSYEYCNTENATAQQRCYLHLLNKKSVK